MIIVEYYKTRKEGVVLNRTYSDAGMMIERDGVRYSGAVDPLDAGRVYTETDEPIEMEALSEAEQVEEIIEGKE